MKNEAQTVLAIHLRELHISFAQEYKFHPKRKWRFDFVIHHINLALSQTGRLAIEIEGGIWSRGRHVRGKGYQADLDKYNAATMMGYRCLRFSTSDVLSGKAKSFLAEHLK